MPSGLANYCHVCCETSFCCFLDTLQLFENLSFNFSNYVFHKIYVFKTSQYFDRCGLCIESVLALFLNGNITSLWSSLPFLAISFRCDDKLAEFR